ncbi:hypothetical protein CEXT_732781 [Caerostris extrusa]|uniref:Uncharacterized protein n=1 Tax=Caerostris extrusa TaxID=172846 RepID=A0AAV4QY40_CAEEX|nr:hypothetical protein CEXT_732781 [Caerostris extrusa]
MTKGPRPSSMNPAMFINTHLEVCNENSGLKNMGSLFPILTIASKLSKNSIPQNNGSRTTSPENERRECPKGGQPFYQTTINSGGRRVEAEY